MGTALQITRSADANADQFGEWVCRHLRWSSKAPAIDTTSGKAEKIR